VRFQIQTTYLIRTRQITHHSNSWQKLLLLQTPAQLTLTAFIHIPPQ
jgi:hypothetical protein